MLKKTLSNLLPLAVIALVVGCGGGGLGQAKLINDLKQTGLAFHEFHDTNQRGPANWDEFIAAQKEGAAAIGRVRDAKYEMTWNVKLPQVTTPTSETVLAKRPSGGPTLMMDGSVKQ